MKKIILSLFIILFLPSIALAPVWPIKTRASQVRANTSNFDVNLSSTDTSVQRALDTMDELTGGTTIFLGLTDTPSSWDSGKYFKSWTSSGTWETPAGAGDMEKATYDTGANDIVDNSEALNGYAYAHFLDTATADSTYLKKSGDDSSNYKLTLSSLTVTNNTTVGGDLIVDITTLVTDSENNRVGIGTASPNAPLEVKGAKPGGNVGGFQSGMFHVTGVGTAEFSNSVITGHSAYNTNTQLWYLGSLSSSDDNIGFLNRQNGDICFYTNNAFKMIIDATGNVGIGTNAPGSKLEVNGTIHSDYGISATTGVFSGQVQSNSRKLIDQYDYAVCISTPNALGTVATLISPFRSYAVTISTISAQIIGGTNVVFMIEQRTIAGIESAGTDIWSGDVTALPTVWTGGAVSDFTVPADSALVLVITSVSGNVDRLMIKYRITKD